MLGVYVPHGVRLFKDDDDSPKAVDIRADIDIEASIAEYYDRDVRVCVLDGFYYELEKY